MRVLVIDRDPACAALVAEGLSGVDPLEVRHTAVFDELEAAIFEPDVVVIAADSPDRQTNAMGGRETGGMATTLAAHMDFDEPARRQLARFWGSEQVARAPGLKAVKMFEAVADGRIKAIWVTASCSRPSSSTPRLARTCWSAARRAARSRSGLVCVCGSVRAARIEAAVAGGAATLEAVSAATGAGASCGSCRPEIARLLRKAAPPKARHAA